MRRLSPGAVAGTAQREFARRRQKDRLPPHLTTLLPNAPKVARPSLGRQGSSRPRMTKVIRNQKSRLPGSTLLREPLDGPHFLSPHPGPLPWGEGESSAVFGPSPRRSLPVQFAQNTCLGGGCSLSPGERV